MNTNGFGFSFNFGGSDDDDDRNNRGPNPFGAGGLGDMLNQFGQMLSGMGSSMNSPDGQGPVNYALAERIARQQIGTPTPLKPQDESACTAAVQLAEMWLDDSTILFMSHNKVEVWNEEQWLTGTLPMWKRMVTPVAEHMNEAQMQSLPEQAREMVGPMLGMMNQMSGMNFGVQLGNALGDLASQTLTGSDFGVPVAPQGVTAILPRNLERISAELDVPKRDALIYLAAREAARQRLFTRVPWLLETLVSSVEEYAAGLEIDTSHIEEAMRELNLESGDPAAIQDAMQRLQGLDMSPRIGSRNAAAVSRLETLLALIEGWTETVVVDALSDRVPTTQALTQAWRRRRATGGSAEKAFAKVVGIEFDAPKVAEAHELWRRVTMAVGVDRRDHIWDHPDFLPSAEDLDNTAAYIDTLLDNADVDDFDPIAEITALEEMLAQEAKKSTDTPATPEGSAKSDNADEDPADDPTAPTDPDDPDAQNPPSAN